jgi:exopolysaccharide biosynthesis polyprenyl glycosylphosphotransferase
MGSSSAQAARSREDILSQVLAEAPVRPSWLANHFAVFAVAWQVVLDFFTVVLALGIAYKGYRLLGLGQRVYYPRNEYLLMSAAVACGFILLMERYGLYRPGSSLLHIRETEALLRGAFLSTAVFFTLSYLFGKFLPSRWVIGLAFTLLLTLVLAQRVAFYGVLRRLHLLGYGVDRVLIYGCSPAGIQVFRKLAQSPRAGLVPVAFVDDDPSLRGTQVSESAYTHRKSLLVVGTGEELEDILTRLHISRVILADGISVQPRFEQIREVCDKHGVQVSFVPLQYRLDQHLVNYQDMDGLMLGEISRVHESSVYRVTKRLLDLVLGGLMLLVGAPVMAMITAATWITDGRPALFSQERIGQFGKIFRMFKFRTMYRDAPSYAPTPRDRNDPRITPVGRFLRRTSLDELPQLFNVMLGEMSLVGPRPEMPFIVAQYTPAQRQRLMAKPGITGLWQISADRAFEIHENIDYDLYYIRNRSLLLDVAILLHTVIFAIRGVGAF